MKKEQIKVIFDELNKNNKSIPINNTKQIWVEKLDDGTFAVFRVKITKESNATLPKKWEFEETFHFDNKEDLEIYLESI